MIDGVPDDAPGGDGGGLARQGQGPDDLDPQLLGGGEVHPAGGGGQVDDQTAGLELLQGRAVQQQGGGGVADQVVAGQMAVEVVGPGTLAAPGLDPGQVAPLPGGNGDLYPQALKLLGKDLAQSTGPQDEGPCPVEGDGQLLHGDLNGALAGGWGVSGMAM